MPTVRFHYVDRDDMPGEAERDLYALVPVPGDEIVLQPEDARGVVMRRSYREVKIPLPAPKSGYRTEKVWHVWLGPVWSE